MDASWLDAGDVVLFLCRRYLDVREKREFVARDLVVIHLGERRVAQRIFHVIAWRFSQDFQRLSDGPWGAHTTEFDLHDVPCVTAHMSTAQPRHQQSG
jgi:hypothetical protein